MEIKGVLHKIEEDLDEKKSKWEDWLLDWDRFGQWLENWS